MDSRNGGMRNFSMKKFGTPIGAGARGPDEQGRVVRVVPPRSVPVGMRGSADAGRTAAPNPAENTLAEANPVSSLRLVMRCGRFLPRLRRPTVWGHQPEAAATLPARPRRWLTLLPGYC